MTVFPPDERRYIETSDNDFPRFPLPAVTAIDSRTVGWVKLFTSLFI